MDAYFGAAQYKNAAAELREYHTRRLEILERLFSFNLANAIEKVQERPRPAGTPT